MPTQINRTGVTQKEAKAVLKAWGSQVKEILAVDFASLVPEEWEDWFWDMFNNNEAPFSFGDAKHTLVTGEELAEWLDECYDCEDTLDKSDIKWEKFIGSLWLCNDGDILIDMEKP